VERRSGDGLEAAGATEQAGINHRRSSNGSLLRHVENMAGLSNSGRFQIDIPATITFVHFYFENAPSTTNWCGQEANTEMRHVGQDS
jgi:hypothetical protein